MTDLVFAVDRAVDAALVLAADRPWSGISLLDIARAAGVPFAELYSRTPSKTALIDRLSRRYDQAALAAAEDEAESEVHDRLFEAAMARLEAMEPHRHVLIAIARAEGPGPSLRRAPRTARALLETAGVDTGGSKGALRRMAMTAVWGRTLQVWRDDEGALNRTMAELDKLLKTMRRRLGRVGAGF
jgi:AcrR family transcriptional regulator